jgi:hypothetical protein
VRFLVVIDCKSGHIEIILADNIATSIYSDWPDLPSSGNQKLKAPTRNCSNDNQKVPAVYESCNLCPDLYRLGEQHLNHTIRLLTSEYEAENFPYDTVLENFLAEKTRRGVGVKGGQRSKAGVTGAFDLALLAQAIRDNK